MKKAIQTNVSLREYTTFHIGGSAEYFVSVASVEGLRSAVAWARGKNIPITILGGGSNVFVSDAGVKGLVIHNVIKGRVVKEHGDEVLLTIGAGEIFDEIVAFAVSNGWWGLENLSCIPGSVGATPIQNIGAYGVEIQDHIVSVDACDSKSDSVVRLEKDACAFGYRDSLFKHEEGKQYIVTGVTYRLTKKPNPILHYRDLALWNEAREKARGAFARGCRDFRLKGENIIQPEQYRYGESKSPTLTEIRTEVCKIRSKKFPDWSIVGTAGSFFKNPIISNTHFNELVEKYPLLPGHPTENGEVKVALGWILDHVLHVRGYREGNVGTYEGQALVVVNHGNATAAELEKFVQNISKKVFNATNIVVEWEVTKLF